VFEIFSFACFHTLNLSLVTRPRGNEVDQHLYQSRVDRKDVKACGGGGHSSTFFFFFVVVFFFFFFFFYWAWWLAPPYVLQP
jgi:hypothetical protein